MEKIAAYIRVSTEEQKLHGISLDAQRDKLKEYADKNNLHIVEWYEDEGVSGRKLIRKRPALQRMLFDAQAHKFERIIFIKLDRFFRSVAEYHECMKIIDPVVWTATEEKYDLTTANGRAFVNMKLTIAELEADQTGERIKIVNDYKVKNGQPLTGAHCMSVAYTIETVNGVKKVVKNSEYEALVCDFISHYLVHQSKRAAYTYVKNKYDKYITYRMCETLVKDTKLYGYYKGNYDYCEPYIDEDTFNKILEISNKNIKRPRSNRVYLFTGLIRCPLCNKKLGSNVSTFRNNKTQKEYINYKCNNFYQNKNCTFNKNVNESRAESFLLNNITRLITNRINTIAILDAQKTKDKSLITKRIKELNQEMKNSTIAFTKGRMTEPEYDRLYTSLESQLKELTDTLADNPERDLTRYKEILDSGWKEIYNALNKDNKRAFWRKFVKEIVLDPDGNIIDVNFFD